MDNNLNISAASEALYTSQPGISKQVGLLENELGVRIFERRGRHLHGVTPVGIEIIKCAERMLELESKIKAISKRHLDPNSGSLNIYTMPTIARYLLPDTVAYFTRKYPRISFHLQPTLPANEKFKLSKGYADFSIVAQEIPFDKDLITLPAYLWTLSLVVPENHPLTQIDKPTLQDLAQYPILSYEQGAIGRNVQDQTFARAGLEPHYHMTMMDADIIKRYVELGMGIGIIASLAARDIGNMKITHINLDHLLEPCKAWLCFSKDILLQDYMYDFISTFSPHLTKEVMEMVLMQPTQEKIDLLVQDLEMPVY
ncbi:LysR substrate-binding domain-containing protein [Parasalinivibrio latis]